MGRMVNFGKVSCVCFIRHRVVCCDFFMIYLVTFYDLKIFRIWIWEIIFISDEIRYLWLEISVGFEGQRDDDVFIFVSVDVRWVNLRFSVLNPLDFPPDTTLGNYIFPTLTYSIFRVHVSIRSHTSLSCR